MVLPHCCSNCCPDSVDVTVNQTILDLGVDAIIVIETLTGMNGVLVLFALTDTALSIYTPLVFVNGVMVASGYSWVTDVDGNYTAIQFAVAPPAGSTVQITYAKAA